MPTERHIHKKELSIFADREVDPKTGAIRLAGIFANSGNVLRPGQYGRVRAITKFKQDALTIPQRAVTELQGTYQVAVVSSENIDCEADKG